MEIVRIEEWDYWIVFETRVIDGEKYVARFYTNKDYIDDEAKECIEIQFKNIKKEND